jgi:hypothetical protein
MGNQRWHQIASVSNPSEAVAQYADEFVDPDWTV